MFGFFQFCKTIKLAKLQIYLFALRIFAYVYVAYAYSIFLNFINFYTINYKVLKTIN